METKVSERDNVINEMSSSHQNAIDRLERKNKELENECRGLNLECNVLKEAGYKIKTEKQGRR